MYEPMKMLLPKGSNSKRPRANAHGWARSQTMGVRRSLDRVDFGLGANIGGELINSL